MRGVSWDEIVIEYEDIKPMKTFIKYTMTGGTTEEPEIETQEKGPDYRDINTITKMDLVDDGRLLEFDPQLYECIEIDGEYFFHLEPERITLMNRPWETYYLIRKVRDDCDRCGGTGECTDCDNTGECNNCGGDRHCLLCEGTGRCTDCDGTGRCDFCEGSGRINGDPCDECGGSGRCPACNGTRKCEECDGSGRCINCGGSGRCGYCNGTLKCRDCKGVGRVIMVHEHWYDSDTGLRL
jgi:hypothetical protein